MRTKTKLSICAAFIIFGFVLGFVYFRPNLQAYYTNKFKRSAIAEVSSLVNDENWIQEQQKTMEQTDDEDRWVLDHVIFATNGEWIVYSSKCSKKDRRIKDTFVGKASDGNWYESNYHFCIGMVTLRMDEQPENLATFISRYELRTISP